MFSVSYSPLTYNPFDILSRTKFEHVTKGRSAAILVELEDGKVPIVRTTTMYDNPAIKFSDLHKQLLSTTEIKYNNAMIEKYDSTYRTMGFHSDQAIDLDDNSYIAIYSCYKHPEKADRKLIVKDKVTSSLSTIPLAHNSIVTFSTETNSQYLHRIVLADKFDADNEWIGITYRLSKTYINPSSPHLRIASELECREFFKLKNIENSNNSTTRIADIYSSINYTISPSDLLEPVEI